MITQSPRMRLLSLAVLWLTLTPFFTHIMQATTDNQPYTAYLANLNTEELAIDAAAKSAATDQSTRGLAPALQAGNLVTSDIQIQDNWTFGMLVVRAPENEHGGPDLRLFIGKKIDGEWDIATEFTPKFYQWLDRMPSHMLAQGARETLKSADPALANLRAGPGDGRARLSWPWPMGTTWYYMSGPHGNGGNSYRPWSSLDLGVGGKNMDIVTSGEGWVYRASNCPNFVRVDHADGWQTGYYHVINEGVQNGQWVGRGTYVGQTSNAVGCGGWSSNQHTHLSLRRNGDFLNFDGKDIGGYTILEGAAAYEGTARRVSTGAIAYRTSAIVNTGLIGSGYYDVRYDYNIDTLQDLWAINMRDTATNSVSMRIAAGGTGFLNLMQSMATGMPSQPEWLNTAFASGDYDDDDVPDLWVIHRWDGAEKTAFRIMSGANPALLIADKITALPMYDNSVSYGVADYDRDGHNDLWAIIPRDANTNGVRVQIVSGTNPQSMLANVTTSASKPSIYSDTNFAVADWDGDGVPDIWIITPRDAVKSHLSVKIISGADFATVLTDIATSLPMLSTNQFQNGFVVADYNNDSYNDLWVVDRKSSTTTVISGKNFSTILLDGPNALPNTANKDWHILGSDRARENIKPEQPALSRPDNAAALNTTSTEFRFQPAGLASKHKFQLRNSLNEVVLNVKIANVMGVCAFNCRINPAEHGVLLRDNEVYTWKVIVNNPYGKTISERRTLTTDIPGPATLNAPFNEQSVLSTPTFTWTGTPQTETYKLVIFNNARTFTERVTLSAAECDANYVCNYTPAAPFPPDTYKWKVVSKETTVKGTSRSARYKVTILPSSPYAAETEETPAPLPLEFRR